MSNYIERHEFNHKVIGIFSNYYSGKLLKLKEILINNPKIAGTLFKQGYDAISDSVVAGESRDQTGKLLDSVKDLGINYYRNVMDDDRAEFTFLGENFSVKTEYTTAYSDPISWSKFLYSAILAKDGSAINELISIPTALMSEAQLKGDPVDFAIMRFLKGLYQTDVDLGQLLMEAMELTNLKINKPERLDYLLYIKFPELNLYRLIFSNNNNQFNIELHDALISHKKFWGTPKNKNAAEGWISYPILCACKIASESKNYSIDILSDYLPISLLK